MRRSRSQLSNLTSGGGMPPRNAANKHAEDIQRRINGLSGHDMGGYPQNSGYAQANPYFHPQPHQNSPYNEQPPYPYSHAAPASIHPPHYADFPPPAAPSGQFEELENLKASIERMATSLHAMQAGSPSQAVHHGNEQNSFRELSGQIAELRNAISTASQSQPGREEFASLRNSVDQAAGLIASAAKNGSPDAEAYAKVVETSHANLARQLVDLQDSMGRNSANPDIYAKTLEASHDDLKLQLSELEQAFSAQNGQTLENVQFITERQTAILEEIETLKDSIESGLQSRDNGFANNSAVESQLEEITRAIVALSNSGIGLDQLERLEARVSDLTKTVSANAGNGMAGGHHDNNGQSEILEALNERLAAFDAAAKGLNNDLTAQMGLVQEKLENISAVASAAGPGGDINPLIARLDALVEQGNTPAEADQTATLSAISEQLSWLVEQSNKGQAASNSADLSAALADIDHKISHILSGEVPGANSLSNDVMERLVRIEEQVASSRDIALELASQVADEAVQKAVQAIPEHLQQTSVQPDPDTGLEIQNLVADIRQLHETSNLNENSALQTFDAVRDSLERMAERLAKIESSMLSEQANTSHGNSQQQNFAETENFHHDTEFAQPDVAATDSTEEVHKSSGNDMVAEYRAVIAGESEKRGYEPECAPGVEALVAEAARAEEERARKKAAQLPDPGTLYHEEPNEREFKSDPDSAAFLEHDLDALPEVEVAPSLSVEEPHINELEQVPMPDEVPIEPGSMGPDLAALVRKANEQRKSVAKAGGETSNNEFIAAARRAAQAAAEEASAVEEEIREQSDKKSKSLLPSLFSKRKKAIMMAAGAALLATLSIPLISSLVSDGDVEEYAGIANSVTELEEQVSGSQAKQDVRIIDSASISQEREDATPVVEASLSGNAQTLNDSSIPAIQPTENQSASQLPTVDYTGEVNVGTQALKEAAERGEPAAMFEVARRHMEGQGTGRDIATAAIWLERAAESGFAPAQYLIGNLNEKGVGVERNRAAAESWYQKAAEQGHVVAMHNLAVLHATPADANSQPNMSEAFKWFSKAADHGIRDSQVNLGIFYTKGVGTEVNLVEAYRWFTLAAKAGDQDAEAKREVVANALRPDQIESARELTSSWRPAEVIQAANTSVPASEWTADLDSTPISKNKQAVAKAQLMLSKLGYNTGPADGIMGNKTRLAITQFQQKNGMDINGEVTMQLLRELEAVAI